MKKPLLSLLFLLAFVAPTFSQNLVTSITGTHPLCHNDSNGTATVMAGIQGASQPIMITEVNTNTPDYIELTNVSGNTVNTDGWIVITSNSYTAINTANTLSWALPTSVNSSWVAYKEDQTGSNYWGNNLFYNNTSPGWVLVADDQGNIVDFVAWGWNASSISSSFNVTFGSNTYNITNEWSGAGVPMNSCSGSIQRTGSEDNDDATDWSCVTTTSKGSLNTNLTIPFLGSVGISYLWSTGDTTASVDSLPGGTYYVTTTASNGQTDVDTIVLNNPPLVPFSLPADTTVCGNSAIFVDAGSQWTSYMWSTGASTQQLLTSQPGVYYCTITDTNNCEASDSIELIQGVVPVLALSDTVLCDSQYVLDAGNPGSSYQWSNGETTQQIFIDTSGVHAVTVTSVDGCTETDIVSITLYPVPSIDLGEDFKLCFNYNHTQQLTVGSGWANVIWSTGSTSNSIFVGPGVTQAGTEVVYATVEDNNGCFASDSVEVQYKKCTGIPEISGGTISLFPNPTSGLINIQSTNLIEQIEIFNSIGQKAFEMNGYSTYTTDIDLSEYASGTYLIKVQTNNGQVTKRILVE